LTCPYCNPTPHDHVDDPPSQPAAGTDPQNQLDPAPQPAPVRRQKRQPLDRRSKLRKSILATVAAHTRTAIVADLDSMADDYEADTASRGKKANWLCPALTVWSNGLEGTIFNGLTETQLRAELIRRYCPLWLAKPLASGITGFLPKLTDAIGSKASISVVLRLLAVWACPTQNGCTSYRENIFKLTFEQILAKQDLETP